MALLAEDVFMAVADIRWDVYAPILCLARPRPLIEDLPEVMALLDAEGARVDEAAGAALRERLRGAAPEQRSQLLLTLVRKEVAHVLGHASYEAVDSGLTFKDLGFDSLTALELRKRLSSATSLRLPATLVFNYPTSVALADYLLQRLSDESIAGWMPIRSELEQLESAIASTTMDDRERTVVRERLQAMLAEVSGVAAQPPEASEVEDLSSASAEEVIDFIDRELGVT